MIFNQHSRLEGRHAFLSASKYNWLNYDEETLINTFLRSEAAARGTELHAFAANAIRLRIKLQKSTKTLNQHVNDAIGYHMTPEQVLYYSDNCFGTTDAISFRKERGHDREVLRIHDLKTGDSPTKFDQLYIYAALFCLEYDVNPEDIDIELRIYQNDDCTIDIPEADRIRFVMNRIIQFDNLIENQKRKGVEE